MNRQEYGRVCKVYMYTSYSTSCYCMKHAILPFANWFLKDIDQKAWFVKVIKYQSWSNRRHVLFRSLSKVFFSFFFLFWNFILIWAFCWLLFTIVLRIVWLNIDYRYIFLVHMLVTLKVYLFFLFKHTFNCLNCYS